MKTYCPARAAACLAALVALATSTDAAPPSLHLQIKPDTVTVRRGDIALLVYQRTPNAFKPYVAQLRTPKGRQPLLDSPSDHIHHHALMFAVSADQKNFWIESPNTAGKQRPGPDRGRFKVLADGTARLAQRLDWIDHDGKARLAEKRTIKMHGVKNGATLLTWRSELRPAKGSTQVKLTGAHYEGLGMRFVREFDGKATFLHQASKPGKVFRGDERLTPGKWCAIHGTVDDKPVTIAMFEHPANPRPVTWFTMGKPFAYLAATLALHEQPIMATAGQPLNLQYGVALWDGHLGTKDIEQTHKLWLQSTQAETQNR